MKFQCYSSPDKPYRQVVKNKLRIWKLAESGGQGDLSCQLKKASRKVYKATCKARRDFENVIASSEDRRLLYSYIKSKSQNRVSVGPLKDKEDKEVKYSKEIADLLANHYSSVFKNDVLPMEEVSQLYLGDSPLLITQFTETFLRLRETLATRPDGIHAKLLKMSCIFIAQAYWSYMHYRNSI